MNERESSARLKERSLPTFDVSDFGHDSSRFLFDLVRLDGREDIPRPFLHRHNYYHLLWMTEARGQHILDFEVFDVRPNTVFFISPGQVHAWTSSIPPSGYVVNFSTEFFFHMLPQVEERNSFPFFDNVNAVPALYLSKVQHDVLTPLLEEMEKEFQGGAPWQHDILRSLLLVLLTRLRRLQPLLKSESVLPKSYNLTRRFKRMVEEQFLELTSVQDYASQLLVTDRRLNEAVKSTSGKTAKQLIHDRIVLEAKRLLTQTEMGIAEIAYKLNFDDPAYFARFFKRRTSLTPTEFKQIFSGPLY